MSLAIWKFTIDATMGAGEALLEMPVGATPLSAAFQVSRPSGGSDLMVWALVDPSAPKRGRRLRVFGTGQNIQPDEVQGLRFLSTAFTGPWVWHVWIEDAPAPPPEEPERP